MVAESRALAEDAAALIGVELRAAAGGRDDRGGDGCPRWADSSPARGAVSVVEPPVQLHDNVPFNTTYTNEMSNGDVDGAFARADRVVRDTIDLHRWSPTPMETRGGVAEYDSATSMLTYTVACQSPHLTRFVAVDGARPSAAPPSRDRPGRRRLVRLEVVALSRGRPDLRDRAAPRAACEVDRGPAREPDRRRSWPRPPHRRRDTRSPMTATILGMRADIVINTGAYPVMPSAAVTCGLIRTSLPGPYRVSAFAARSRVVVTNTTSHTSLRGPWAIETLARRAGHRPGRPGARALAGRGARAQPADARGAAVRDRVGPCASRLDGPEDADPCARARRLSRPPGAARRGAGRGPDRRLRHRDGA